LNSHSLSKERGKEKSKAGVQRSCLIQVATHQIFAGHHNTIISVPIVKFLAHQKSISCDVLANHQREIHPITPIKKLRSKNDNGQVQAKDQQAHPENTLYVRFNNSSKKRKTKETLQLCTKAKAVHT